MQSEQLSILKCTDTVYTGTIVFNERTNFGAFENATQNIPCQNWEYCN